jgi:diguanylate cyclase (GGDEF)-like protein
MSLQHVVIVDDDRSHLNLMTEIVETFTNAVPQAFLSSGTALSWCAGHDVDCFILDQEMPPPNGIEMIRLIREEARFAFVPIVIVTGLSDREVRRRALRAGANDFLEKPVDYQEVVARLSTLLALHDARKQLAMSVESLEASLLEAEARSREHAERLEALWKIVTSPSYRDDELLFAMLRLGAHAVRPGQVFHGVLGKIDGSETLVEATYSDEWDKQQVDAVFAVGRRSPVADSAFADVVPTESIRSWDDIDTDERLRARSRIREIGWRSLVLAPFKVGGVTYVLEFGSFHPTEKPFGPQDHAYVEILVSLFATHFRQRWQAERIQFELQHDSLTGLLNRVQLRTAGRAAFRTSSNVGIAIVDIDRLRHVNRAHGHIIGDAILVEVAAALAAQAVNDEIVARVGGDSFAVLFPSVPSHQWLADRLSAYKTIFETPFSTGDREGTQTVPVSATIAVAVAPDDGTSFDELLLLAEATGIDAQAAVPSGIIVAGEP